MRRIVPGTVLVVGIAAGYGLVRRLDPPDPYFYSGGRMEPLALLDQLRLLPGRSEGSTWRLASPVEGLERSENVVVERALRSQGQTLVRITSTSVLDSVDRVVGRRWTPAMAYRTAWGDTVVVTGEIVVRFAPTVDQDSSRRLIESLGGRVVPTPGGCGSTWQRIALEPGSPPLAVANRLIETGAAISAQPNFVTWSAGHVIPAGTWSAGQASPAGPQSPLDVTPPHPDIGAQDAWTTAELARLVKVMVVDLGFDPSHVDLRGQIVDSANLARERGMYGNDGFATHGNGVSGIIAARNDNPGLAGVCPQCKLVLVRVPDVQSSDDIACAVDTLIAAHSPDIVSMSLDVFPSDHLVAAFADFSTTGRNGRGGVVVIAGPNGGNPAAACSRLAGVDPVIGVASFKLVGRRTVTSPIDSCYDVIAPAGGYLTVGLGDSYPQFSGTSAATPAVAGAIGLLLQTDPDVTAKEVRDRLDSSAKIKIGDHEYPKLNALSLLKPSALAPIRTDRAGSPPRPK